MRNASALHTPAYIKSVRIVVIDGSAAFRPRLISLGKLVNSPSGFRMSSELGDFVRHRGAGLRTFRTPNKTSVVENSWATVDARCAKRSSSRPDRSGDRAHHDTD